MPHRLIVVLLLFLATFWPVAASAQSRSRLALLVGNSDYNGTPGIQRDGNATDGHLNDLPNACNDVQEVAAQLELNSWDTSTEVRLLCDASSSDIRQAVISFAQDYMLLPAGALGFIYYAGHGVQVGDKSYIFGTDTQVDLAESISRYRAYPDGNIFTGGVRVREELIDAIGTPGDGSIFLVLDACRENPIIQPLLRQNISVTAPSGAQAHFPGLKILYSTADGEFASDGSGAMSPFAEEFVKAMTTPDRIETVIASVVRAVARKTALINRRLTQLPQEVGSFQPPPPILCFHDSCV